MSRRGYEMQERGFRAEGSRAEDLRAEELRAQGLMAEEESFSPSAPVFNPSGTQFSSPSAPQPPSSSASHPAQAPTDDEALAKALQEEYDREHNELRFGQQSANAAAANLPDYRQAGYQTNNGGSGNPGFSAVGCSMCRQVNQVPFTGGPVSFRCEQCGFLNHYTPPMAQGGMYGGCNGGGVYPVPLICSIQ